MELLVFVLVFVLLGLLALRFGAGSHDDRPNWP